MSNRSLKPDVRNPVLRLTSARLIQSLPIEQRRLLGILLRDLAKDANEQAERAWKKRKGPMAVYWRATSTYAKHLARAIDPWR